MSFQALKQRFLSGSAYWEALEELEFAEFDAPGGFEALKLPSGALSVGACFEGASDLDEDWDSDLDDPDPERYQAIIQERAPQEVLLLSCNCTRSNHRKPCAHLLALLLLFWGLLRREYPWVNENAIELAEAKAVFEGLLEPQFDLALERPGRSDPDEGLCLEKIIFRTGGDDRDPRGLRPLPGEIARGQSGQAFRTVVDEQALPEQLLRPGWRIGLAESQILGCVQYLFSNGCVLSAAELMNHRWIKKVPRALLPLREVESGLVPLWARTMAVHRLYDPGYGELSRAMLGVVARALDSGFAVSAADTAFTPIVGIRGALAPEVPVCKLVPGALENQARFELSLSGSQAGMRLEEGRLVLSPGPAVLEALSEFYARDLNGQEVIQEAIGLVQGRLVRLGLPGLELPKVAPVSAASPATRPALWFDEGGVFSFSRELPALEGRLWNFDAESRRWLGVLRGGVGEWVEGRNTEVAHSHRGRKRDADLKILRHCGFAASVFYECACFAFREQASTGERFASVAEFKRWLKGRASQLAATILGGPEAEGAHHLQGLEKLCSHRVVELVQQFANQVLESLGRVERRWFLVKGQGVWVESSARAFGPVAERLIAAEAVRTGGRCFAKARVPVGLASSDVDRGGRDYGVFSEDEAALRPTVDGSPIASFQSSGGVNGALQACLPLAPQGFDIFWKGKPVALLAVADLKTVFNVHSSTSHLPGASGPTAGQGPLDWFELNPKVFLLGRELDRGQLGELSRTGMIEYQGRLYSVSDSRLPSLRRLSRFWDRLQGKSKDPAGVGGAEETYRKLPRSESLELLALEQELGAEVQGDCAEWRDVRAHFRSLDQTRPAPRIPAGVRAELKPFQAAGFQWLEDLYALRLGGVLADDMGLGKTLQALVFLEALRERGRLGRSLIVVPTSLAWNWKSEAARFVPGLPLRVFEPKDKAMLDEAWNAESRSPDPQVLVVTYGLLTEHSEWFAQGPGGGGRRPWSVVIFDEAQNLKNIRSKRSDAARLLLADYKYCLTGTPLENHLGELYSILDLAVPGCLGELRDFTDRYEKIPDVVQNSLELAFLRRVVKPLVLRRTKSQVLAELPPKTESRVGLPLERQQKKIYRDVALSWNRQVQESIRDHGEARSQLLMLTALLRLRQVCSDPASVPGVRYAGLPPKIELLAESVAEILEAGESALVFTQFLATLERVRAHLEGQGAAVSVIHGAVSRAERERILREFQDPAAPPRILVMTLKTGGVGLNLTRASYVFHLEPWWNPAVENQATDRAHRLGQERPVQVYRYLMNDTVEEKIELLKARKSAVFEAVMTDAEGVDGAEGTRPGLRSLSRGDFELLLKTVGKD